MKRSILIFLSVLFLQPVLAQRGNPGAQNPRSHERLRAAHAAFITEKLELTPTEAEKFWPLYREYAIKRREIRQALRETHRTETDEKKLLELELKARQEALDLEREYLGKFQEVVPAEKILKLNQAEADFRKLVFRQIQQRHRQRRN